MTVRAVILGLLVVTLIAAGAFINDYVLKLTPMIGTHLPVSVFGGLILFVLAINPLLGWARASWQLRPSELAVSLAIAFAGCGLPSNGFYRTFGPNVALLPHWNDTNLGWQKVNVMKYAPVGVMADEGRLSQEVTSGFVTGLGRLREPISLGRVPWAAWRKTILFWVPLVAIFTLGLIGLTFVLHEQWSRREHMPYPIAEVAHTLIDTPAGSRVPSIFRHRAFWYAAGAIAAIHGINVIHHYYPNSIQIPLEANFSGFGSKVAWLTKGWPWGQHRLLQPRLYFTPVAFAFFMRTDAALSLGLARPLWLLLTAGLYWYGLDVSTGTTYFGGFYALVDFGAYFAMAVLLIYTGRHFFVSVFKRILWRPRSSPVSRSSVWGLRLFMISIGISVWMLHHWANLPWPFALMVLLAIVLSVVIVLRINVETGMFCVIEALNPPAVLWAIFGPEALGPKILIAVGMPVLIFGWVVRENIMPFIANGLRVFERISTKRLPLQYGPQTGRLKAWLVVAMLVSLLVALPVVMWAYYNYGNEHLGAFGRTGWLISGTVRDINKMADAGVLKTSINYSTWERLTHMQPSSVLSWALVGAGFVLACGVLRLRYTWWPLHPVAFLLWIAPSTSELGASFLLGAIVKTALVRLWGGTAVRKIRPLLFGVVAGDLIGGLISILAGAGYYLEHWRASPNQYFVFPGY